MQRNGLCQKCSKDSESCRGGVIDAECSVGTGVRINACLDFSPPIKKERGDLFCFIMNILDFRYWICGCGYYQKYGKIISAHCKKHN